MLDMDIGSVHLPVWFIKFTNQHIKVLETAMKPKEFAQKDEIWFVLDKWLNNQSFKEINKKEWLIEENNKDDVRVLGWNNCQVNIGKAKLLVRLLLSEL